jgi:hypothetical protein
MGLTVIEAEKVARDLMDNAKASGVPMETALLEAQSIVAQAMAEAGHIPVPADASHREAFYNTPAWSPDIET